MVYADSRYYIVDFDGMVIPKKKANKFCIMATYCINYVIPEIELQNCDSEQLKRCCCRIAEILYGYCKENDLSVGNLHKREQALDLLEKEQIKIQIRNTIILYLKINILQKAE